MKNNFIILALKKIGKVIYNILLFILLLPFNLVKYLNLSIYYIMKFLIRESPEKKKQREEREKIREEMLKEEQKKAQEYIRNKNNTELEFTKDTSQIFNINSNNNYIHKSIENERKNNGLKEKEILKKEQKNVIEEFKKRNVFAVKKQQKLDKKRKVLLFDINGDDSKRSSEKLIFKYIARNPKGKIEKGTFQGYSKLDVHSYLLSEGYEVYEIKLVAKANIFNVDLGLIKPMKKSTLVFYLTQLSTYLKAGIPIVDSIKILCNQAKSKTEKTIWKSVLYELSMGATLSDAMIRAGVVFPKLLINMVKTAEITGNLEEVLDDQANYYKSIEKARKEMINAITYPTFVLAFSIIIVSYIIMSVVPQFVNIYNNIGSDLPGITKTIINISNFIRNNYSKIIIIIISIIVLFILLYKKNTSFKSTVQYILMHIPIIGNIIIYNEMTMFSKTFSSLINNNIFITDSMDILGRITNNEIYKKIINKTLENLGKGDSISTAFRGEWAIPVVAYEMIVTGETTGQLGSMMEKVAEYYGEEHTNAITRVKVLIEPIMIVLLSIMVGGILLAVIIPMFSMYQNII